MGKKTYVPPGVTDISVPDVCWDIGVDQSNTNDFDFAKPRRDDEDADSHDESVDRLVSSWSDD
jgi:hypothetical protein